MIMKKFSFFVKLHLLSPYTLGWHNTKIITEAKFVLNCAFNTLTARHRTTTGGIRENEKMKADIHSLLSEAYRAGIAEGVQLPDDLVEVKYDYVIYRQPAEGTSSMARDVEAHRTIELDAFTGTVLRLSQKHGLAAPVTQEYHEALRNMTKQG